MSQRHVLAAAVILLTLGAGLLSWYQLESRETSASGARAGAALPQYVIEAVTSTQYDDEGQRKYRLQATRLEHYPGQRRTDLAAPRLWLYQQAERPWQLRAAHGRFYGGETDKIRLWGEVEAAEASGNARQRIRMRMAELTVFPTKRVAETEAKVTITAPSGQMTAQGMEANFANDSVKLRSRVRGHYRAP